jgi:hypothetical protein
MVGIFNYIVDPSQQYRKATLYPMYFKKNQRYILPGMAKNYDYESIVIGSSMTENFIIDQVESILNFNKCIKFCISGGTAYEEFKALDTAFKHKQISKILYGLDIYSFMGTPTRQRHSKKLPIYLYDDNIFNDYKYLLNKDIFINSLKAIINPYRHRNDILYQYNYMWQWQHEFEDKFDQQLVYENWLSTQGSTKKFNKDLWSLDKLTYSFDENFIKLVKSHPETEFIVFYPPYSILTFYDWKKEDILDTAIAFKKYVYEQTKDLKNVKIYDFQIANQVILNLNNYRDYSHYHQKINTWMLEEIVKNHYLVTEQNIDKNAKILKQTVLDYKLPNISKITNE